MPGLSPLTCRDFKLLNVSFDRGIPWLMTAATLKRVALVMPITFTFKPISLEPDVPWILNRKVILADGLRGEWVGKCIPIFEGDV